MGRDLARGLPFIVIEKCIYIYLLISERGTETGVESCNCRGVCPGLGC